MNIQQTVRKTIALIVCVAISFSSINPLIGIESRAAQADNLLIASGHMSGGHGSSHHSSRTSSHHGTHKSSSAHRAPKHPSHVSSQRSVYRDIQPTPQKFHGSMQTSSGTHYKNEIPTSIHVGQPFIDFSATPNVHHSTPYIVPNPLEAVDPGLPTPTQVYFQQMDPTPMASSTDQEPTPVPPPPIVISKKPPPDYSSGLIPTKKIPTAIRQAVLQSCMKRYKDENEKDPFIEQINFSLFVACVIEAYGRYLNQHPPQDQQQPQQPQQKPETPSIPPPV